MRIFLVLLANVYLERSVFQSLLLQIGKCKASTVVSLALDSLHFSGRNGKIANITQQGHLCGCDQPCPWLPACTSHLFPWSLKSLLQEDADAVAQTQIFYVSLNTLSNC